MNADRLAVIRAAARAHKLARHATFTALAAVTADGLYTLVFWLILGRDERRAGRYPEVKYFAIIGQLAVETAAIVHLISLLRKAEKEVAS